MTDQDDPSNVIQLADRRAQVEAADNCDDEQDDRDPTSPETWCWVVDEGDDSFVALAVPLEVDADGAIIEPDDADALAVALVRAAQKCREARGES